MDKIVGYETFVGRIKKDGFCEPVPIGSLQEPYDKIDDVPGVYMIIRPEGLSPVFNDSSNAYRFKGREPSVARSVLESKWLENEFVIYIGKAGRASGSVVGQPECDGKRRPATLRSRLRAYFEFGRGKPAAHWGGRYIWQIKDPENLLVTWKQTNQDPATVESRMLEDFKDRHRGCLPFANLKAGKRIDDLDCGAQILPGLASWQKGA